MKVKKTSAKIELKRYRWAIKIFVLAICLSSLFSLLSQTILSSMGVVMAVVTIVFFIFISVVFDMVGTAITCAEECYFLEHSGEKGATVALAMKRNSEKVCSFCNDVIGDICGILSGASGACVILGLTKTLTNGLLIVLVSSLVSALIAGLTIFSKALMKSYAINNANKFILKIGRMLENTLFFKKRGEKK